MSDSKLQLALEYHHAGDLEKAKEIYSEILVDNPKDVDALHLLSILLAQQKNFFLALDFIRRAIAINFNNALLHNCAGNILSNLNLFTEAQEQYEIALKIDSKSASTHNNLANLLSKLDKFDAAKAHYQRAIEIRPEYVDALYNLGLLFIQHNAEEEAVQQFLLVIGIEPENVEAYNRLAQICYKQNKLDKAVEYYQTSLKIDADNETALENLGAILAKIGEFAAAIPYLQKALKLNPKHLETLHNLGSIFVLQNNHEEALRYYMQILSIEPNFEVYYNIGVIYMDQNRNNEALPYFYEALKLNPNDLALRNNLAAIYLKMEDYARASENYRAILQIKPKDKEVGFLLSALEAIEQSKSKISAAPKEYLQHLFDQYASHYDAHLTRFLQYRVPDLLYQAVVGLVPNGEVQTWVILDLGCGTGLCGQKFKKLARTLVGIDLSAGMLAIAREKNIYDKLYQLDIVDALARYEHAADLILAADSLVYSGDLDMIFKSVRTALKRGGYFAFTCEKTETYPFVLQKSARFAHAKKYIVDLAEKHEFSIVQDSEIVLRKQKDASIIGNLYILKQ